MTKRLRNIVAATALLVLGVAGAAHAMEAPTKRAKPPNFPPETVDAFFADAREHLVGERPANVAAAPEPESEPANGEPPEQKFAWSRIVSGDTLATEVKRIAARVRQPLANLTRFKADGHVECQANFSQLAVLFGIIAQYDGDVRWHDDAPTLRDALSRAAASCKTADEKSFAEAVERATEVEEVVRGGRLGVKETAPFADDAWSALAARTQLMQRIQTAYRDRIRPQLSSARQFEKAALDVQHEAEMMAALADVMRRPQYEYWDDETFVDYSRELQAAATELSRAAAANDYNAGQAAVARAGQACANCHDGYRL